MKNPLFRAPQFFFAFFIILPISAISQQSVTVGERTFEQRNGKWFQRELGRSYEVNHRIITMKFKSSANPESIKALHSSLGVKVLRENIIGFVDIELPIGQDPINAVQLYNRSDIVEVAEPTTFGVYHIEPNDPKFQSGNQWYLKQTNDADIDAPEAWNIQTGSSIVVAILDNGIDWTHEDLGKGADSYQNIWLNSGEDAWVNENNPTTGNQMDDDGNGYIDDWKGWNFDFDNNNTLGALIHGTHVSGIVAAKTNNGKGVAGVAGGWGGQGARMMAVGVGDLFPIDAVLDDAILYAAQNGAKVIQMSLSVPQSTAISTALQTAYQTYGCFIVCSSGNESSSTVSYPASSQYVVAVGAANQSDVRASFSNYGNALDLVAPGVNIYSTQPGNAYNQASGTSFSSPQVSGVAALIWSLNSGLSNAQVENTIKLSADKVSGMGGQNFHLQYGYGRLNANKAVRNLYVPQVYATITSALSTAISGQTVVVSGQHTISSNLIVNSGVTLQFNPGASIAFTAGKSLTVNGTLTAVGTSGSPITFTKSGGSNWNGIVVNSTGSANIQYANISYAGTGIHVNGTSSAQTIKYCNITNITNYGIQISNSSSGSNDISYNTIYMGTTCIYLNNASAIMHQNTINSYGGGSGIYTYGSGFSLLANNIMTAYHVIYANYYSRLYLLKPAPPVSGHNEALPGGVTLEAYSNSTIEAGGVNGIQGQNSFYGGGLDLQAATDSYSTIIARYNWWNGDFSYVGNVDMSNPLGSDPNGGWSGKVVPTVAATKSTQTDKVTAHASSISESSLFDESLEVARNSMAAGDYNEAIRLFSEKVKSADNLKRKKYALAQLAECYHQAGRGDFIDFLKNEVRPDCAATDELYVSSLELEGIALIGAQRYAEAAAVYEGIKSNYPTRSETYKHALFNLANLYQNQLGDNAKAKMYAEELKAKYPDDALTDHARILLAEDSQSASAEDIASEQNENTQEQEMALESYPNPFNPSTQIRYSIKDPGYVSLKVYDLLGREVAVLVNEQKQPGIYSVEWNAGHLPSGMYFSRFESSGRAIIQKLLLVR